MTQQKVIKTTTVSYEAFHEEGFKPPSNYFIRTAMGDYFFVSTKDRKVAQAYIDEVFGEKRYRVNSYGDEKGGGNVTCKATTNSASRRGNNFIKIRNNFSKP